MQSLDFICVAAALLQWGLADMGCTGFCSIHKLDDFVWVWMFRFCDLTVNCKNLSLQGGIAYSENLMGICAMEKDVTIKRSVCCSQ